MMPASHRSRDELAPRSHAAGPLTVLHLIPTLTGGGAERQLAGLAPALNVLGAAAHVAYVRSGVHLSSLQASAVATHEVPSFDNHDPMILARLVRLIGRIQPQVVQTWLPQMDVLGGMAAKLTRVPHVLSERASTPMYPPSWKHWLRARIGLRARAVVANSHAGLEYWSALGFRGHVQVVHNGVDVAAIAAAPTPDPATLGFPADAPLVLFAGRMAPEKNLDRLLDALGRVCAREHTCRVALFGEGPLQAGVEARVRRSAMHERIRIPGYTQQLWGWMRSAAVLVFPSLWEGSPNVVIEAMAAGCPLVISDIAAHRELLDDESALFCDQHSAPAIADAILACLTDRAGARRRADVAKERARSWAFDAAARRYLDLYEALRH